MNQNIRTETPDSDSPQLTKRISSKELIYETHFRKTAKTLRKDNQIQEFQA